MGDYVNYIIDNLVSVTWRLMELPLYFLILSILILLLLINTVIKRAIKKVPSNIIKWTNIILFVVLISLIVDKKIHSIKKEMAFLNEKVLRSQMGVTPLANEKSDDLIRLEKRFPSSKVYERKINNAIQLINIQKNDPNVAIFISIIDLDHPDIKIKITPEKKHKYTTSLFAKENDCILAINGEAGESMAMDCELGEWTGNWIVNGKVVMLEDSDKRPFIGFDKSNKATYFKSQIVDTIYTESKYNAIWGRHDVLMDGSVQELQESRPYSRTIMGSNKKGNKLFLMVVDGKRPDYSIGLTYVECAEILKLLGANNAMACDQGGSSCMYISPMGGIINRPADSDGIERPIYSHFGISM